VFYEGAQRHNGRKLKGCDLFVVRVLTANSADGRPRTRAGTQSEGTCRAGMAGAEDDGFVFGNSRPCLRCVRALHEFGVRRVFFTIGSCADQRATGEPASSGECVPCGPFKNAGGGEPGGQGRSPPSPMAPHLCCTAPTSQPIRYEMRSVRELYLHECATGGHTSRGDRELERTLRAAPLIVTASLLRGRGTRNGVAGSASRTEVRWSRCSV